MIWLLHGESPEASVAFTWKPYWLLEVRPDIVHVVAVMPVQLETFVHDNGAQPEGDRHSYCRVYDEAPVTLPHEIVIPVVDMFVGLFSVGVDGSVIALCTLLGVEYPPAFLVFTL